MSKYWEFHFFFSLCHVLFFSFLLFSHWSCLLHLPLAILAFLILREIFFLLFLSLNWFDLHLFLNLIRVSSFLVPNPATEVFLAAVSAKELNSWDLVVIQWQGQFFIMCLCPLFIIVNSISPILASGNGWSRKVVHHFYAMLIFILHD